jgi:hypothetical protein
MSQDTAPTQPPAPGRTAPAGTPSAEKQALLEAYDTVLKHQAEIRSAEAREAEARRAARRGVRPVVWTCAALTLVLCSYLLIERPDWLFPAAGPVESVELQEASIRISMANAAQHIQRYRQQTNRLPETLTETGAYGDGIEYTRIGNGWRMTATQGTIQLTLTSGDALAPFIGNSFEIISRRAP